MKLLLSKAHAGLLSVVALLAMLAPVAHGQTASVYYICPGNVFTNTITAKDAEQRGCKAREAQQPTTIAGPRSKAPAAPANAGSAKSSEAKIDQAEQKARDTDARRILEQELKKEEEALEALKSEYRNGEPERRGDERNYQKYLDRVAELKAAISRKEADLAAIRRELNKQPS